MSLPVTSRIGGPYNCDGVVVAFAFGFKVFTSADIRVVRTTPAGVESDLVIASDYTVSLNADQETNPGGTITTLTTYTDGKITIVGSLAYGQPTVLTNLGGFFPKVIEAALDRLGILIQQLKEGLDRALTLPVSAPSGTSAQLPVPAASSLLGWNTAATALQNYTTSVLNSALTTAYSLTLLAATTAAQARTILGLGVLSAKGSLYVATGANTPADLPVPANSRVLIADSAQTNGWNSTLLALHGNCQLTKSGANLLLSPFNGNTLIVNSLLCTVPDAGVTLAPPAVASTTYYIYAVATNGVITSLENSATAPAVQAGTGIKIKNGDATRTLVGMARTTAGNAWADTSAQRFVRSWFNDYGFGQSARFSVDRSTSSATFIEVNSEIRSEFLLFSGETYIVSVNGAGNDTGSANRGPSTSVGFDSTTVNEPVECYSPNGTMGLYSPVALSYPKTGLSEGYHYVTLLGRVIAGGTVSNYLGVSGTIGAVSLTGHVSARH